MSHLRDTFLAFLSPLKEKSERHPCVLHNFDTLRNILIIFVVVKRRTNRHIASTPTVFIM